VGTIVFTVYGIYCYNTKFNPYITFLQLVYEADIFFSDAFLNEERGGIEGRIQSTFWHPLTLGGISILLFFFFLCKNIFVKVKSEIIILILLIVNAFLSGSRSALVAVAGGLLYLFIVSKWKVKLKILIISTLLFIIAGVCFSQIAEFKEYQNMVEATVFFWNDRISEKNNVRGSTAGSRLRQLEGSIELIKYNPLFGLGSGYSKTYLSQYGSHTSLLGFESIIFIVLVETGFLGFALWIIFFYLITKLRNKAVTSNQEWIFNKNILNSFFVVYMIFIVFTGSQSTLYLFLVLYILQLRNLKLINY
jgi:hypothetical protein